MKKSLIFTLVVCLVSWAFAALMYFGIGIHNATEKPFLYTICATVYMFMPMLCAMAMQLIKGERFGETSLLKFKLNWTWLIAWILPLVIVAVTIVVNSLMPNTELGFHVPNLPNIDNLPEEQQEMMQRLSNPKFVILTSLLSGFLAGITINAVCAFGEEYAWRNYLVNALKKKNFWIVCLFVGIVWGFWHFPLILMGHNYPTHHVEGVFMMVAMCLALTPIEVYLVLKAKSVIPAAIFHGTFNAFAGFNTLFISGGNDLLNGCPGLSGIITMLIITAIIFIIDRFFTEDNIMSKTVEETLNLTENSAVSAVSACQNKTENISVKSAESAGENKISAGEN